MSMYDNPTGRKMSLAEFNTAPANRPVKRAAKRTAKEAAPAGTLDGSTWPFPGAPASAACAAANGQRAAAALRAAKLALRLADMQLAAAEAEIRAAVMQLPPRSYDGLRDVFQVQSKIKALRAVIKLRTAI